MSIPTYYLFHLLNETKKLFTPSNEEFSAVVPVLPVGPSCGIIIFSTSKFDEMTKFLSAIGFVVTEGDDPLLPLFSEGRGARVRRGDFEFNLEENTSKHREANFSMMLMDLSEEELAQAKSSGYKFTHGQSFYGESYTFKSPDGGTFVIR